MVPPDHKASPLASPPGSVEPGDEAASILDRILCHAYATNGPPSYTVAISLGTIIPSFAMGYSI